MLTSGLGELDLQVFSSCRWMVTSACPVTESANLPTTVYEVFVPSCQKQVIMSRNPSYSTTSQHLLL